MDAVVLEARAVQLDFGGIRALDQVSLAIPDDQIVALVGPNGSGKTSMLNVASGIYKPTAGTVVLNGRAISGLKSYKVAELGVARTFQHVELFGEMTVLDNILLGCHKDMRGGVFANGVFWGMGQKEEVSARARAEEVIDFLELSRHRKRAAGGLPLGIQKLVGLARALVMRPRVILLDEPASGMNRQEKEDLARFLLRIRHELHLAILWVEHDMKMVVDIADRMVVLNFGRKIAEGHPAEIVNDPAVHAAYFGSVPIPG